MPVKTRPIPFGQYEPDKGEYSSQSLVRGLGYTSFAGKKIPVGDLYARDGNTPNPGVSSSSGVPFTAFEAKLSYGAHYIFVGMSDGDMYQVVGSTAAYPPVSQNWAWNDVTPGAWATSSGLGNGFCQFGPHVLTTSGFSNPGLYWKQDAVNPYAASRAAAATSFAQAVNVATVPWTSGSYGVGAYYAPRLVTTMDDRAVIGSILEYDGTNTYDQAYRVHWSATNDVTSWGDESSNPSGLCGYVDLQDNHGHVWGLCGAGDYCLIFKTNAIYRLVPNVSTVYGVYPVKIGMGCRYPTSIIRVERDVFFWGPNGPTVFRGLDGSIQEIALGRLSRSLQDPTWLNSNDAYCARPFAYQWCTVAHEPVSGCVIWLWKRNSSDVNEDGFDKLIIYNYQSDEFSILRWEDADEQLGAICGLHNTLSLFTPLKDVAVFTYEDDGAAGYDIKSYTFGSTFTSPPSDLTFRLPFLDIEKGVRVKIDKVRLVATLNNGATTAPHYTCNIRSREFPLDSSGQIATTAVTSDGVDKMGWLSLNGCPSREYHSIEIDISATNRGNLAEIEGVEIEYTTGGMR